VSRPLIHPDEGPRKRLEIQLTDKIREHLALVKKRERLTSLASAVDWLLRRDRAKHKQPPPPL
jgi:hypothetical protein